MFIKKQKYYLKFFQNSLIIALFFGYLTIYQSYIEHKIGILLILCQIFIVSNLPQLFLPSLKIRQLQHDLLFLFLISSSFNEEQKFQLFRCVFLKLSDLLLTLLFCLRNFYLFLFYFIYLNSFFHFFVYSHDFDNRFFINRLDLSVFGIVLLGLVLSSFLGRLRFFV